MKKLVSGVSVTVQTLQHIKNLLTQNLHPEALKLSISSPTWCPANLIFDQAYPLFLKSGHVLHARLSTILITHFSRTTGGFDRSLSLLFDTYKPDVVAFTSLLSGYALFHCTGPAFALYGRMLHSGLRPSEYTLSSLIKSCVLEREVTIAHGICVKYGVNSNGFLASGLVQKYGRCGCLDSAWKCYRECLVLDDVVCTAMINASVWNGDFVMGKEVFVGMRGLGLELNEFSLTAVIGTLWNDVDEGEQIHALSMKMGFLLGSSIHLSNVLMSMYCRSGSRIDSAKVFEEISQPDVVSWTVRVSASCDGAEAFDVFKYLHSNNYEMNELTLINLLSAIDSPSLLMRGKQVHSLCYKRAYLTVVSVGNALISMYGKCNKMEDMERIFMELVFCDLVSWNSLIGGYCHNGLHDLALATLCQMRKAFIEPDQYTIASILGSISGSEFAKVVMQIHTCVTKVGLISDDSMLSVLITSYGRCNSIDEAKKLFAEITSISMVHFHVMAATAIEAGCFMYALDLFVYMRNCNLKIDCIAYNLVFKACSSLTNLALAKALHSLVWKSGVGSSTFIESALIDAYCKCGSISDAEEAFKDTSKDDLAAWNAMIMGYAQHNHYHEALHLFKAMNNLGVNPDEITYIGILNSCCHAGRVKEAHVHLQSMFELHGVVPCLEHYSCAIDVLGGVRLLREAKNTIDQMPCSPDARVWQSLLSACNLYGDLHLGEVAA